MGQEQSPQDGTPQRLDKWLFFARLVKSRSLAQAYIQSGAVRVNDAVTRQPSHKVKPGDRLEIGFERLDRTFLVKAAGERRGPYEEARHLYEELTPPRQTDEGLPVLEQALRRPGSGRPTKKERRALDRLFPDSGGNSD